VFLCAAICIGSFARRDNLGDIRRAEEILTHGGTMSWSRHVTGQDFNDVDVWHNVESVCVIPGSSNKANGDARADDEVWLVANRNIGGVTYKFVEQMQALDWGTDDDYCWFVDGGKAGNSNGVAEQGAVGTPGTYTMTYYSYSNGLIGIPIDDTALQTLTNTGVAVDRGGGLVGLPMTTHPFSGGDVVIIEGTTNYDGTFTLDASTTANELRFADTYAAETFGGTETVVQIITPITTTGLGRSAMDSSGNTYFGHTYSSSTHITKVAADGTMTTDDFDNAAWPINGNAANSILGIALSADESSLYLGHYVEGASDQAALEKFDVATGNRLWGVGCGYFPGYAMGLDASDNVYVSQTSGGFPGGNNVAKFASADGTKTSFTDCAGVYEVVVDDTLDLVICGGWQTNIGGAGLHNLAVRKLDDTVGDKLAVGGTYVVGAITYTYLIPYGGIATDGTHIYVLLLDGLTAGTPASKTIYKYSWNGTSLTEVATALGPTYGNALYIDLYGNLVVVNQSPSDPQDDILYFYDTDLNPLSNVTGLNTTILSTWRPAASVGIIKGDVHFNGTLSQPGAGFVAGVSPGSMSMPAYPAGADFCVYADGRPIGTYQTVADANGTIVLNLGASYNVVIAGFNYYSILETFPLSFRTNYGPMKTQKAQITDLRMDFYESMGCNLGTSLTEYSEIQFSDDAFATAMDAWTGAKIVTFPRGITREPLLYLWIWEPIPMKVRALYPRLNVVFEGQ
jgi:hypothetical protein